MMLIGLGILTLSLGFGVAWINTRLAGLLWVSANFLAYQWAVEATRGDPDVMVMAANLSLALLTFYISVMALSGIGAAHLVKRSRSPVAP